mmetsp:Transcript_71321/g.206843  ORF Transcript_71321/g.206843 Transcript_71321/m.206843 type:complete len:101 (-) Transcript_71321:205-507(-)
MCHKKQSIGSRFVAHNVQTLHHISQIGTITSGLKGLDIGRQASKFTLSKQLALAHFIQAKYFANSHQKSSLKVSQCQNRTIIHRRAMQELQTISIDDTIE